MLSGLLMKGPIWPSCVAYHSATVGQQGLNIVLPMLLLAPTVRAQQPQSAPPIQVNYFSLHLTLVTRSICHADDHDDIARCPWLFSPGKSGNQETHKQTERQTLRERQQQRQRQRSPLAEWQRQPHQSRPGRPHVNFPHAQLLAQ